MQRAGRLPLVLLTGLTFSVYFTYHAITGRHGFGARQNLIIRTSALEREIGALEAVRTRLQRDVALLAPEQPHPDIIEFIAADVLGLVRPDAKVVIRSGS